MIASVVTEYLRPAGVDELRDTGSIITIQLFDTVAWSGVYLHLVFLPGILNLVVFGLARSHDPRVKKAAIAAGVIGVVWFLFTQLLISFFAGFVLSDYQINDIALFFMQVLLFLFWIVLVTIGGGTLCIISKSRS